MDTQQSPKQIRDPAVRVVLLPKDTNQHGTIFGGVILAHLDIAGGVEAAKHTDHPIVTVAMNQVVFKEPVHVGEVVSFYASTTKVGRTSVSVHMDVEACRGGKLVHVTAADLVYVSIDKNGVPRPLRP